MSFIGEDPNEMLIYGGFCAVAGEAVAGPIGFYRGRVWYAPWLARVEVRE